MEHTKQHSGKHPSNALFAFVLFLVVSLLAIPSLASAQAVTASAQNPYCIVDQSKTPKDKLCYPDKAACDAGRNASGATSWNICNLVNVNGKNLTNAEIETTNDPNAASVAKFKNRVGEAISAVLDVLIDGVLGRVLEGIAYAFFWAAGIFLAMTGSILDMAINVTINSSLLASLAFVNVGWTAVRDFSNMVFIFVLLYVAIQTILDIGGGNTKRIVAHVIIAAILINFSLFFTKVVIDAGNILAVTFHNKLVSKQGDLNMKSATAPILGGLDLQTIWSDKTSATGAALEGIKSPTRKALLYAGGAIFMLIAAYVVLACALMMVSRTVHLIILMVFSPFAFMSFGMPKLSGVWNTWWQKLVDQTFAAPIFLFMMYLNSILMQGNDLTALSRADGQTWSAALGGDPGAFGLIFNFVLVISFLLATIGLANKASNGVGAGALSFSKWATGGAVGLVASGAFTATSAATREMMAARSRSVLKNPDIKKTAVEDSPAGRRARAKIALANERLTKSYDARNTWVGGKASAGLSKITGGAVSLGAGSKATFKKDGSTLARATGAVAGYNMTGARVYGTVGEEQRKRVTEEAKSLFPNDAQARERYMQDRLGTQEVIDEVTGKKKTMLVDDLDKSGKQRIDTKTGKVLQKEVSHARAYDVSYADKDVREETKRKIVVEENKAAVTKAIKEGTLVGEALTAELKPLFDKLTGEEGLSILTKEYRAKEEVINAMNKQQVAYMVANPTKYTPDELNKVAELSMRGSDSDKRQYIIGLQKLNNPAVKVNMENELRNGLKEAKAYEKDYKEDGLTGAALIAKREELMKKRQDHDRFVQDVLGSMKAQDVARMKQDVLTDTALVGAYTDKHYDEIQRYNKGIAGGDVSKMSAEQKAMFKDLREKANTLGGKGKTYMNNQQKDKTSAYFDPTLPVASESKKGDKKGSSDESSVSDEDLDMI